jgi:hypothetical protein
VPPRPCAFYRCVRPRRRTARPFRACRHRAGAHARRLDPAGTP